MCSVSSVFDVCKSIAQARLILLRQTEAGSGGSVLAALSPCSMQSTAHTGVAVSNLKMGGACSVMAAQLAGCQHTDILRLEWAS